MNRLVLLLLVAALVTGCAFVPQSVSINPSVEANPSQVGNGRDLPINVVDERAKKTLGTVAVGSTGADIAIEGDLVNSVQRALADGLSRANFKPTTTLNGGKSELRVEIKNLDYTVIRGLWSGTLRVDAGLKAICVRNGTRPYERLHRGEKVESIQIVQSLEANTQYINTAVSAAVNSLLSDQDLLTCLAQPAG
jgi:uncharacterized lipoprotein YajG